MFLFNLFILRLLVSYPLRTKTDPGWLRGKIWITSTQSQNSWPPLSNPLPGYNVTEEACTTGSAGYCSLYIIIEEAIGKLFVCQLMGLFT